MSRKCGGCKKWLAAGQYDCRYCGRGEAAVTADTKAVALSKLRASFAAPDAPQRLADADVLVQLAVLTTNKAPDPLPEDLLGLAIASGQSVAVLTALVDRGCKRVASEHAALAASVVLTPRLAGAKAVHAELAAAEEAVRIKMRQGPGSLSGREQGQLADIRARLARLCAVDNFAWALQHCTLEADDVARLRALLDELLQTATILAPAREVVPTARTDMTSLREEATPKPVERDPGQIVTLLKRGSAVADEELCGDDAEQSPALLELEVALSEDGTLLTLTGSLHSLVRQVQLKGIDMSGFPIPILLSKGHRMWTAKIGPEVNHRHPLTLTVHVAWFPPLSMLERAHYPYVMLIYFETSARAAAMVLPAPFTKPKGLALQCVRLMAFNESAHPGTSQVVERDLLLTSLARCMCKILDYPDTALRHQRRRHLITLYYVFEVFRSFVGSMVEFDRLEQLLQVVYDITFTAEEAARWMRPLEASVDALVAGRKEWTLTRLFSMDFIVWLRGHIASMHILGGKRGPKFALTEIVRVLQVAFDSLPRDKLLAWNPLFRGITVCCASLSDIGFDDLSNARKNRGHVPKVYVDWLLSERDYSRAAQLYTLALGRLSPESPLRLLPKDVLKYLADRIPRVDIMPTPPPGTLDVLPKTTLQAAPAFHVVPAPAQPLPSNLPKPSRRKQKQLAKARLQPQSTPVQLHEGHCFLVTSSDSLPRWSWRWITRRDTHVRVQFALDVEFEFARFADLPSVVRGLVVSLLSLRDIFSFALASKECLALVVDSPHVLLPYLGRRGLLDNRDVYLARMEQFYSPPAPPPTPEQAFSTQLLSTLAGDVSAQTAANPPVLTSAQLALRRRCTGSQRELLALCHFMVLCRRFAKIAKSHVPEYGVQRWHFALPSDYDEYMALRALVANDHARATSLPDEAPGLTSCHVQ